MTPASRYELRDRQGDYVGTFVTDDRSWQTDDVFTTGDGRVLRIIRIAAVAQRSRERPGVHRRLDGRTRRTHDVMPAIRWERAARIRAM